MTELSANEVIQKFGLVPLPEEGGFYKQTFKDSMKALGDTFSDKNEKRSLSTCIYYLVTESEFSGLHSVKSTEIFHFYAGDPVRMVQIRHDGKLDEIIIGNNIAKGEVPQVIVEPYVWQGTKLLPGGSWALMGCTVSPGFEFEDFINGNRDELTEKFPQHRSVIKEFTHHL